jgi:hypothetical protein
MKRTTIDHAGSAFSKRDLLFSRVLFNHPTLFVKTSKHGGYFASFIANRSPMEILL